MPISPRVVSAILLALTLLAAGLRIHQLGAESFWYDETWTASWADQPVRMVLKTVNPLAYVIAHLSLQLGRSEYILRFAPALVGVLTVPAVYALGRRLCGRREGLIAAFFLSVSVYPIYHSQELRFYAWQMLFSTLSLYFLLRGLDTNRLRYWTGFTISTVLNLYNHPFALFVFASEGLYVAYVFVEDAARLGQLHTSSWPVMVRTWFRRALWPGIAAAIALVAYLPQWSKLMAFYNPDWALGLEPTHGQPLVYLTTTWLADPLATLISGMFGKFTHLVSHPLLLHSLLGLVLLGLVYSRKRTIVLTLIWVLLPFTVLLTARMLIYERYFSYFLPLLLIIMARAVAGLSQAASHRPKTRTALLLFFTLLAAAPNVGQLPNYYATPQKDQWRELTALIDAQHQPGDLVLASSSYVLDPLPFEWYSTTPQTILPRRLFPESGILTSLDQLNELSILGQEYHRVWLIFCSMPPEFETRITDTLGGTQHQVDEWSFQGLRLLLFEAGHSTIETSAWSLPDARDGIV